MALSDHNFDIQYRSDNMDKMISEFYTPALEQAIEYKRAVGFFSSTSLSIIATGLSKLISNKGSMKLIISQRLSKEDADAIEKGYKSRNNIIEEKLIQEFKYKKTDLDKERYNYLAHLISSNKLDIKIAVIEEYKNIAIYHEKIGIIKDKFENIVAFSGSLNESRTAYSLNFESIDVYCSWINDIDEKRATQKEKDFDEMWENRTKRLKIYDFPDAVKERILQYKKDEIIPEERFIRNDIIKEGNIEISTLPTLPKWLELRDYQKEAINAWKKSEFVGLFNMATGTGKTLTALASIVKLIECKYDENILIIIVCPYTHLVEQWKLDIKEFNINPIIAYSDHRYKDWQNELNRLIRRLKLGIVKSGCVVTTNTTYKSKKFQNEIVSMNENILIVIDEAHNAGSQQFSKYLLEKFKYRLALSATPERYNDESGTSSICRYFKREVFNFSLERAISEGYLTKYFYYPQIIYLTEEEREKYSKISKQISKYIDSNGKVKNSEFVELLLIKRARIIAGAENKIKKLKELMSDKVESNYNLIYCGATETKESESDNLSRQITAVTKLLGNDFGMKVAKFTAEETIDERKDIIRKFSNGIDLQAIVAIKCLDEGVNIPAIRNAFILASTTNPREFIQRRGRVLRKYKGKNFAYIYDFITLPRSENQIYYASDGELKSDLSLIKKEVTRIREFANLAENKYRALKDIEEILSCYDNLILE